MGSRRPRSPEEPENEALQRTKPAFPSIGAVFAAERRCSTDSIGCHGERSARAGS
jgi:hypothetical protein